MIPIGPHICRVVSRNDPEGAYRVTVRIAGVIEPESEWLWPVGEGTDGQGRYEAPPVNSLVTVWFPGGREEFGIYLKGPFAGNAIPEEAVVGQAGDNVVWEDALILLEEDSRSSSSGIRLKVKSTGDTIFEYDAVTRRAKFFAATSVEIEGGAQTKISGATIQLGERVVVPSKEPIK